jgi:hypothetical protein
VRLPSKPTGVGVGDLKIVLGAHRPFFTIRHIGIGNVPKTKLRPDARAAAPVEEGQPLRRPVARRRTVSGKGDAAHLRRAKHLALHGQERQFVAWIQYSEIAIELETVDDKRLRAQAYMLGPQVAVTFHDVPQPDSFVEQRGLGFQQP